MRAHPGRVTGLLAGMTALAYVASVVMGNGDVLAYLGGFIPARIEMPDLLARAGLGMSAVPVALTPLTATLLHGSWMHLGFNLLILVYCGRQVEMLLGGGRMLLLYAIGAYASAFGQWAFGPHLAIPMIGASGAISALIGAYALLFSNQEVRDIGPIPASVVRMVWLGAGWVALQLMLGIATRSGTESLGMGDASGIAIGAHIGGFVAGMILTKPLLIWRFRQRPQAVD